MFGTAVYTSPSIQLYILDEVVYPRKALDFSAVLQFPTVLQNNCFTHFIMDNQNYFKYSVSNIYV